MTLEHVQKLKEFLDDFTQLDYKTNLPAAAILINEDDREEVLEKLASHDVPMVQVSQDQSLDPVLRFIAQQLPKKFTFALDIRSFHTGLITHLQDLISGIFSAHLAGEEERREIQVPKGSRLVCIVDADQYGNMHVGDLFQLACNLT